MENDKITRDELNPATILSNWWRGET